MKIKLNLKNLFQNIWMLSLDNQSMNKSLQKDIQHLKIKKYYIINKIIKIFSNKNNNLLNYKSILSGIDPLLMME
jgi:hypothetical protein